MKNIRVFFRLKKENEAIKDIIIMDIRTVFEQEDITIKQEQGYNN